MELTPVYLKAPIRAVIYRGNTLIWGEGDLLHIDNEAIRIPGTERIIGLNSGSNDSIFIRTEFNLFKLTSENILKRFPLVTRDRILAVLDEGDKLWVVQARGSVQLFTSSSDSFKYSKSLSLSEFSAVFYSASIIRKSDGVIEIAYGTIFSGILMAQIHEDHIKSIGSLSGHSGTIFDISHHPKDENILVSCSDDRSIRIWKRSTDNLFGLSAVCTGHEARVWSIAVKCNIVASVSEDNTCRIWDFDGNCIKLLEGDSYSKSIWSVALNDNAENVTIGMNDASIITYNLTDEVSVLSDYILPEYFGMIKNIVINNKGICYAATDQNKLVKINDEKAELFVEIDGISKFPAMAVNSNSLFIADKDGNIYRHNFVSTEFEIEKLLTLTTVSKIYAQDDCLLIECFNSTFYFYNLLNNQSYSLTIDKKYKVTSFCHSERIICIGTRQGVLLVFDSTTIDAIKVLQLTQQESLKSIRIDSGFINVFDRSGYEIIVDTEAFEILSRKKIGKGTLECYIGNNEFISSFYQQHFIVYNSSEGVVGKVFCGGGHRLWSVSSDSKNFYFAFMSNGKLSTCKGSLEAVKMISAKSHGKEIRCSHLIRDELILSGSEDGFLILYDGLKVKNELRLSNTSIKCIASVNDLIFVGGSNETIEVFKLNSRSFLNHLSSCQKQIKSIETRVLCLDAVIGSNDDILIIAGYSDASIRLFQYQNNDTFILKAKIEKVHQKRCVQQVRFLQTSNGVCKFISAGADGVIQGWIYQEGTAHFDMLWNFCPHQSGINSIDLEKRDEDSFSVLTGGEDGSVSLCKVLNDKIIDLSTSHVHNSTVTGVNFLENDYFVSVSIDRDIKIHNSDHLNTLKTYRTVISDISAITLTSTKIFVYGTGIEAFVRRK